MEKPVSDKSAESLPAVPKADKSHTSIFSSVYANVAGVALTITSGLSAAVLMINKNFFKNADKEKLFDELRKTRDSSRTRLHGGKSLAGHEIRGKGLTGEALQSEIRTIEKTYEKGVMTKISELGINSPLKKWGTLRSHQKNEVLVTSGAVLAGAIIGLGTIISGREAVAKQSEIEARLNEMDASKNQNSHSL